MIFPESETTTVTTQPSSSHSDERQELISG
jgi:hypothetical protein